MRHLFTFVVLFHQIRPSFSSPGCFIPIQKLDLPRPEQIELPQPFTLIKETDLPEIFDWRNVLGVNYVLPVLNQHIPKYCGSCWAHAALGAVGDRLKISQKAKWPEVMLSIQFVLNCGTSAGSCMGGSDLMVYKFMHQHGVPDDTCEVYQAEDFSCRFLENRCRNCEGPPGNGRCFAQPVYDVWTVSEYGSFEPENPERGHTSAAEHAAQLKAAKHDMVVKMKSEIYLRGPISCGIDADPIFNYDGKSVVNATGTEVNHVVVIMGWGIDQATGEEYWLARNSWGSYWGERGVFKVKTGMNAILIESGCSWAVPENQPHRIDVRDNATKDLQYLSRRENNKVDFYETIHPLKLKIMQNNKEWVLMTS